jgi:quinol monooxygenase YgiN
MIEKWESAELLDEHGQGAAVAELNLSLEGLLAQPVDVTRLVPILAGTEIQGAL